MNAMVHKMPNGYMRTYDPERYQRLGKGDIYEHVYVFEKHHQCCVLPWGHIHHQNGVRDDNRIENLEGMTESQHTRKHMMGNQYSKKDMTGRFCNFCNSLTTYIKPSGWPQWFIKDGLWMCRKCHDKERWINKKGK